MSESCPAKSRTKASSRGPRENRLHLAASSRLVKSHPPVRELAESENMAVGITVRLAILGWQGNQARRDGVEQMLRISPVLISEGVTSIREAVRDGLGVALLPDWLIADEIASEL